METVMMKLRRRKIVHVIGILAIAAVIFLFFQIFALDILTRSHGIPRSGAESVMSGNFPKLSTELSKTFTDLRKEYLALLEDSKVKAAHAGHENESRNVSTFKLNATLGAAASLYSRYTPDDNGLFTCLTGDMEKIAFSKVNDDYCDCTDGSDEPGTSACENHSHSRFHCSFQVTSQEPLAILSSRVNDGICDCCDGSDEWGGVTVPPSARINDRSGKNHPVHQAPCEDHCDDLRKEQLNRDMKMAAGRLVKENYLKGMQNRENPKKFYGPNGEFLKLAESCFTYKMNTFEYNICPFESVRQQEFPHPAKILGRKAEWLSEGVQGIWQLKMGGGDSDLCPDRAHREVIIEFICGTKDEVRRLRELEKCSYQVELQTPAVC